MVHGQNTKVSGHPLLLLCSQSASTGRGLPAQQSPSHLGWWRVSPTVQPPTLPDPQVTLILGRVETWRKPLGKQASNQHINSSTAISRKNSTYFGIQRTKKCRTATCSSENHRTANPRIHRPGGPTGTAASPHSHGSEPPCAEPTALSPGLLSVTLGRPPGRALCTDLGGEAPRRAAGVSRGLGGPRHGSPVSVN